MKSSTEKNNAKTTRKTKEKNKRNSRKVERQTLKNKQKEGFLGLRQLQTERSNQDLILAAKRIAKEKENKKNKKNFKSVHIRTTFMKNTQQAKEKVRRIKQTCEKKSSRKSLLEKDKK